ncbi:MAG: Transcriptional regulator, TetR family [Actinomycetia bacterium]|nr:Transcriptional regulator, TetR family [Actinomycetes bacterium]
MTSGAEVVVRPLSATQAATRHRLLDAARELATGDGYEAVGMRAVAKRAGVSAPTAYLYFSSKDHLLVDVLVELAEQTTTTLATRPRPGHSSVERAVATLRRAVQNVEQAPNLYIAMTRAYIAGSPAVAHARVALEASTRRWVDLALGDCEVGDREAIVRILEDVLFANMVGLVTGGRAPGAIADELELAARTLLRDR